MTTQPPALPERQRLAREVRVYREAIERDARLFDRWADSTGMVRPGQAAYMRMRAKELRELLNAASSPMPGVPAADRPQSPLST